MLFAIQTLSLSFRVGGPVLSDVFVRALTLEARPFEGLNILKVQLKALVLFWVQPHGYGLLALHVRV